MKKNILTHDELQYWSRMFNIDPIVIQLLQNRGIDSTEEHISSFLFYDKSQLLDPFLLPDMKKAVSLIISAIRKREIIGIFGDYDVDGITSTSILVKALRFFGATVIYRLPLREEGYGLTTIAVNEFHAKGVALIITVDNGSTALEAAHLAKKLGMGLAITDHHQLLPSGEHPICDAFINPQRKDGISYPFPHICGAAIAFKLVQALFSLTQYDFKAYLYDYLELAALGTIADMMPLQRENRIIAGLGLKKMQMSPSTPFAKMLEALKLNPRQLTSSEIGFRLAPIFNAAGRVADPNLAVSFLLGDSVEDETIAKLLQYNDDRKSLTNAQTLMAESIVQTSGLKNQSIMVIRGDFHEGVIGIIASRISNLYARPAIILTNSGKGSARSGPHNFSIVDAISSCSRHLLRFGGHKAAAGLSVIPELIDSFAKDIQETFIPDSHLQTAQEYDLTLHLHQFSHEIASQLRILEPYGVGNPEACFYSPNTEITSIQTFGKDKEHIKFIIRDKEAFLFSNFSNKKYQPKISRFSFFYSPSLSVKSRFIIHDMHPVKRCEH
ncbi:single-stranded-DNA-specific exonuclease RecJ [Paenibacillus cremeus]|nr:single-stranded-DNA-specific exonuclease RecJ [Paenibacillus cremeus]